MLLFNKHSEKKSFFESSNKNQMHLNFEKSLASGNFYVSQKDLLQMYDTNSIRAVQSFDIQQKHFVKLRKIAIFHRVAMIYYLVLETDVSKNYCPPNLNPCRNRLLVLLISKINRNFNDCVTVNASHEEMGIFISNCDVLPSFPLAFCNKMPS